MTKVILGTSSRWRRQVMDGTGIAYDVATADIDEKAITAGFADRRRADPRQLTLAIARAKAEAIRPRLQTPALLVTCDQVVFHRGDIREKPETEEECRAYIRSYRDHPACTCSAVVVTNTRTGRQVEGTDIAEQHLAAVPDDVVDALIREGSIMSTAGALRVEAPEMRPFLLHRVGTVDSIMGLPLALTARLLLASTEGDADDALDPATRAQLEGLLRALR